MNNGAIGVIDSGAGGLTVAKEIIKALPNEDIIYFGDSFNCPYGNRTKEEIISLTRKMLDFLVDKKVKCIAIACNTISTVVNELRPFYSVPLISIVESAVDGIEGNPRKIGLVATNFTVKSGLYEKFVKERFPKCEFFAKGSANLAAIVDSGDFESGNAEKEIKSTLDMMVLQNELDGLILGCTHFPIVEDKFNKCYPGLKLINPAKSQCAAVKKSISGSENTGKSGKFELYTTGNPENYVSISKRIGMRAPDELIKTTL